MAFLAQLDVSDRQPNFTWDDRPTPMAAWMLGAGVSLDDRAILPTSATQTDKKKLCDVFPMPSLNAVSGTFRQIVEEFEPGVHQFFPITLRRKDGVSYDEEYFIFNACKQKNAILARHSKLSWDERKAGAFTGMPYLAGGGSNIVVSRPQIANHHIWVSTLIFGGRLFLSNEIAKRLQRAKIRYLWLTECVELDEQWSARENMGPTVDWLIKNQPEWVSKHYPEWLRR